MNVIGLSGSKNKKFLILYLMGKIKTKFFMQTTFWLNKFFHFDIIQKWITLNTWNFYKILIISFYMV